MRVPNALLIAGLMLALLVPSLLLRTPSVDAGQSSVGLAPVAGTVTAADDRTLPEQERPRSVYDISLHDPAELELLLGRLEALSRQPNPRSRTPEIALVLHGPELKFFAIGNYARHQALVDLAAKLDAFQVIEVKACQTMLRQLELAPEDMPAFIEIVPFGPNEVERLVGEGYLRM